MKYIFIDPSGNFEDGKGHTGIATMIDDDWSTLKVTSLAAKNYKTRLDYWKAIITVVQTLIVVAHNNATVIIESFQIRTNGFLIGKMPETIMLIGAIVWELEQVDIPYKFQTPTQAKSRFKDESLPRYIPNLELRANKRYYLNGKMINDHVRDALKHLLYFKRYGGIK